MTERPKLKIELTLADKAFEIICWFTLAGLWALTLLNYPKLPNTIPTHFDIAGQIDDYGSKTTIFILPIIGTFSFVLLTILNRFPHVFNYPVPLTSDNALRQYTNATRMMRYLKFAFTLQILFMFYQMLLTATGKSHELSPWATPLSLALVFVPLIFYIVKAFKMK